jgi:hypothetical protein
MFQPSKVSLLPDLSLAVPECLIIIRGHNESGFDLPVEFALSSCDAVDK